MRGILLSYLLAAAAPSSAAPLNCAKNPKRALPALIERAMKDGGLQVLGGISAALVGWGAPAKELLFPGKDGSANLFSVVVAQGKSSDDLHPVSVVLLRSVASPGKLDTALEATDVLEGGKSTGTKKTPLVDEDAGRARDELLGWVCDVVVHDLPSYQEQVAAQAKKIGAPHP
jgi:hypothetical protein